MIKLNSKMKKIIREDAFNNLTAYIYRDGVYFWDKTKIQYGKERLNVEKNHVFFGDIRLPDGTNCIMVRNCSILLDGVKEIRVYRNNSSENTKKMGLTVDTWRVLTVGGMEIRIDRFKNPEGRDLFCGDVEALDHVTRKDTMEECVKYKENVIYHNQKPEVEKLVNDVADFENKTGIDLEDA